MTTPPKDAVSVLREALQSLYEMTSRYAISDTDYGIVCNAAAALDTERAATHPAGERYTCKGKGGDYELIGRASAAGQLHDVLVSNDYPVYRDIESGLLFVRVGPDFDERMELVATPQPIPSPVQEAKAEQVGDAVWNALSLMLDVFHEPIGMFSNEARACEIARKALSAPASKSEASELPPLPPMRENQIAYTTEQTRAYGQLCRQTAPSSVTSAPDLWPCGDCGKSVKEACSNRPCGYRAMQQQGNDARQPVAAPSEQDEPFGYITSNLKHFWHPGLVSHENAVAAGMIPLYDHKSAAPVAPAQAVTDEQRYHWLVETFGQTALPCFLEQRLERGYIADGKASIDAVIDAAILAKRAGSAAA